MISLLSVILTWFLLFSRCLGFPDTLPSRTMRKSSVSTLGSAAGSKPTSVTMDASWIDPGSRATRTTATPQCVTSSSKWTTLGHTSTLPRRRPRSTTTPTRWHRPCRPQTLTLPLDPWAVRAMAARIATASHLWSQTSHAPSSQALPRPPMAGRGVRRTGWSVLSASTAVRPFTSLTTGEAGARMRQTLYGRASGGSAACGWQTPCSTTACQTQRGTTQIPAPVMGVRAAGADASAHAG